VFVLLGHLMLMEWNMVFTVASYSHCNQQWRYQDLLRGGAKMEIMSWGTHGGL